MQAQTKQQGAAIQDQERMLNLLTSQFEFATPPSDNATMADKLALMRQEVTQQATTVTNLQTMADQRHQCYQTAQTALQTGKQLAQAFEDRKQTAAALAQLAEQKQTQQDRLKLMERLTWVQEHEAAEQRVQRAARDLTIAKTQLVQTQTAMKTAQQAMDQAQTKLNDLQQQDSAIEAKRRNLINCNRLNSNSLQLRIKKNK